LFWAARAEQPVSSPLSHVRVGWPRRP
jgi:hypothetical protein